MTIKALYPASRPSLDLNFAATKRLDPRITFSRASAGTYVDADGLIKSAATGQARFDHSPTTGESLGLLVEEARTNVIIHSETLATSSWTKGGITVISNATTAPDGKQTASLLVASAGIGFKDFYQSFLGSASANTAYTFTVYAKAKEATIINVTPYFNGASFPSYFNIETGQALGNTAGNTSTITSCGNGWYRCSVTRTSPSTLSSALFIARPSDFDGQAQYTGNGSNGFYLWGAQVEAGSFPTSYIPTPATFTSRASTATFYDSAGIIQTAASGVARSNAFFPDSNGVFRSAGLLLEGAATNLLTYSQEFDNAAWVIFEGGAVTANTATAPDSTTTADTLAYDGVNSKISITRATTAVLTIGTIYSQSFFVKVAGGDARYIQLWCTNGPTNACVNFDLTSNSIGSTTTNATPFMQKLANGWYRIGFSGATDSINWQVRLSVVDSSSAGRNGGYSGTTASILAWGAQLETGSYPTSYIPTTTATVTRAADVSSSATVTRSADVAQITGTNFSSWYNQSQGTAFVNFDKVATERQNPIAISDGTGTNRISVYYNNTSVVSYISSPSGGFDQSAYTTSNPLSSKYILGYSSGDTRPAIDGNLGAAITEPNLPINTTLFLGRQESGSTTHMLTGHIARLAYWPTRLSDATLQALTR